MYFAHFFVLGSSDFDMNSSWNVSPNDRDEETVLKTRYEIYNKNNNGGFFGFSLKIDFVEKDANISR